MTIDHNRKSNFKFQSDSINTILPNWHTAVKSFFKFQSDSINTTLELGEREATYTTLNSNLILLILWSVWQVLRREWSLNSNLILLIRKSLRHLSICITFKFQSDSINTEAAARRVVCPIVFKFQSDSINTPFSRCLISAFVRL